MNTVCEENPTLSATGATPEVKMRMLQQMAEALEDEAACLCHRAASFEEEEFLLNRQIEERQLEISRLQLRLEAQRCDHESLLQQIGSLRLEAAAMREEACNNEDEIALSVMEDLPSSGPGQEEPAAGPVFFQRLSLTEESTAR